MEIGLLRAHALVEYSMSTSDKVKAKARRHEAERQLADVTAWIFEGEQPETDEEGTAVTHTHTHTMCHTQHTLTHFVAVCVLHRGAAGHHSQGCSGDPC